MLSRIELKNFKSWRSLNLELAPLTLLFGTNSSGKSSVLQALLLLKQTANSFDRGQHINFGGTDRDYVDLGSYRDLIYGHDEEQRVNIHLAWASNKSAKFVSDTIISKPNLRYSIRWRKLTERVVVERLSYEEGSPDMFFRMERQSDDEHKYEAPRGLKDTRGRHAHLPPPESCYGIPANIADYYSDFYPLEFNLQFENLMTKIYYLGPLRFHPERDYLWTGTAPRDIGRRGERTVEALIASERRRSQTPKRPKKRVPRLLDEVSEWLVKMKLVSQFQIEAIDNDKRYYTTRVRIDRHLPESSLIDVGFGISQVLPVITLLFFAPENSIVLLEQPELHLHPSAQAELADLMLHVAEKRGLQLIVESHSEHLLRRLQRRVAEVEYEFASPDNIKTYFCIPREGGSELQPVHVDLYGQIQNWPENFFGDISGELDALTDAALSRRRQELLNGG